MLIDWKYICTCPLASRSPPQLGYETQEELQQQVNPRAHILYREELRPEIRKPVNIKAGLKLLPSFPS